MICTVKLMAVKDIKELHEKLDKLIELSNNTNVRVSVVETKIGFIDTSLKEKDIALNQFISESKKKRELCEEHFKAVDNTLNKGQGAVWMVGFAGIIMGLIAGVWAFVSGFIK